jgi:hypothetical protein
MPRSEIPELDELSAQDELVDEYRRQHGCEHNTSHWDLSEQSLRFFLTACCAAAASRAGAIYLSLCELELGGEVIRRPG